MKFIFSFFLFFFSISLLFGQKGGALDSSKMQVKIATAIAAAKQDTSKIGSIKQDSIKTDSTKKKKSKFRLKRSELNFVIIRSFIAASGLNDSTPIVSIGSGGLFLGAGYNFNLNDRLALHLQPGLNFYKLRYKKVDAASFPAYADTASQPTLTYKRQLMTYVELPVGIVYTFKRDEKKSRVSYLEVGVFAGINISNTFKVKYSVSDNTTAAGSHNEIRKARSIPYANPLRYGAYARVGRGFVSLYAGYRFSAIFNESRYIYPIPYVGQKTALTNPKLIGLEIGLGIVL